MARDRFCHGANALVLLVLACSAGRATAGATSYASVELSDYPPPPADSNFVSQTVNNAPDLITAALPSGASGSAQSVLGTGAVGASLVLPAAANYGFYDVTARWSDDWAVSGSMAPTVPVGATITLEGSVAKSFLDAMDSGVVWPGEVSFSFRYTLGDHELVVQMGADSSVPDLRVALDDQRMNAALVFSGDPGNAAMEDFRLDLSANLGASSGGFSDAMNLSLDVNGSAPSLEALHTFRVALQSLDPTVTLTSDSGRLALPVPEPGSAVLLAAGIAAIGWLKRRSR